MNYRQGSSGGEVTSPVGVYGGDVVRGEVVAGAEE